MTRSEPRSDVSTNASGSSSLEQTLFFEGESEVYVLLVARALTHEELQTIVWLFSGARHVQPPLRGTYVGPRREMLSPWSTNTSDVLRNVGIEGVRRVERFRPVSGEPAFDPMLEMVFDGLDDAVLHVDGSRAPSVSVTDIGAYSAEHGLALSADEVEFLETTAKRRGRSLTDAELFGFGQLNSEHCRHKIFNGAFVIDGKRMPSSLFSMIKETSKRSGNRIISAYKDNVAFVSGFPVQEFAPQDADAPSMYRFRAIDTAVCVKAETHNYPTTVEPFYGASTGSGGEIRDRMAGGQGSIPLAGTAVYMASYSRLDGEKSWEKFVPARAWRYQSPEQILVKASNGASDFGNKFGQPLIVGSLFTFEMLTQRGVYAFDRCIMLAGGIGYADRSSALKRSPKPGDKVVLFGGDNYRIGLAGAAVSSVDSGVVSKSLELSAVQRANPEMQKRVFNVVRALAESGANPIVSIHDHGAGGHMNCFAELLEETGGRIDLDALPIGDPTLSDREIISNESQERMGLIVPAEAVEFVLEVARRERAPAYVVGEVTNDQTIRFVGIDGREPVVLETSTLFGSTPRLEISGSTIEASEPPLEFRPATGDDLSRALQAVLSLEGVACKDWLTNKVDRCVSGRVAQQQTVG
ncbi:MAG: phosphoribosylformylglycinamidine synthase, partial [Deltaproteobacteria bacterium]|nr:phosphoribosylformylglycinamidine synthase [Deltaproteobacteria bacterium]